MNRSRKVETDRFKAVAESGEVFTIIEVTNQTGFTPVATGVTEWLDSIKEYQVASGGYANRISDTEYLVVSRDKLVKRV